MGSNLKLIVSSVVIQLTDGRPVKLRRISTQQSIRMQSASHPVNLYVTLSICLSVCPMAWMSSTGLRVIVQEGKGVGYLRGMFWNFTRAEICGVRKKK